MTDEQLSLLLEAFIVNNNDFELNTSSFRIISDHTLFVMSFVINDFFIITKTKGVNQNIVVSKDLDVNKFMSEISEYINLFLIQEGLKNGNS